MFGPQNVLLNQESCRKEQGIIYAERKLSWFRDRDLFCAKKYRIYERSSTASFPFLKSISSESAESE